MQDMLGLPSHATLHLHGEISSGSGHGAEDLTEEVLREEPWTPK